MSDISLKPKCGKDCNDSFEEFFISSESNGMKGEEMVNYTLEYIRNRPYLWQSDDSDYDEETTTLVPKSSVDYAENPTISNFTNTGAEIRRDRNNNVLKIAASLQAKGTVTRTEDDPGYQKFKQNFESHRDRQAKGKYYREKYQNKLNVKAKFGYCSSSIGDGGESGMGATFNITKDGGISVGIAAGTKADLRATTPHVSVNGVIAHANKSQPNPDQVDRSKSNDQTNSRQEQLYPLPLPMPVMMVNFQMQHKQTQQAHHVHSHHRNVNRHYNHPNQHQSQNQNQHVQQPFMILQKMSDISPKPKCGKDCNDSFEEFFVSSESNGMKGEEMVNYTLEYIRNRPYLWQSDDSNYDKETKTLVPKSSVDYAENPTTSNSTNTGAEIRRDRNNNVLKIAASLQAKGTVTRTEDDPGYQKFKQNFESHRDRQAKGKYYREKYQNKLNVKAKFGYCSSSNGDGAESGMGATFNITKDGGISVGIAAGTKADLRATTPHVSVNGVIAHANKSQPNPDQVDRSKSNYQTNSRPEQLYPLPLPMPAPVMMVNSQMQHQQMQQAHNAHFDHRNGNGHYHHPNQHQSQNQNQHVQQSLMVFHINLNIRQ